MTRLILENRQSKHGQIIWEHVAQKMTKSQDGNTLMDSAQNEHTWKHRKKKKSSVRNSIILVCRRGYII